MATEQKQTEDKKVKYRTEEKDKKKKKKKHKHMNPIFFELPSLAHGGRKAIGKAEKKSVSDESSLAASPEKSASAKSSVSAHLWLFWDQNPCPTKPPFPNRLLAPR